MSTTATLGDSELYLKQPLSHGERRFIFELLAGSNNLVLPIAEETVVLPALGAAALFEAQLDPVLFVAADLDVAAARKREWELFFMKPSQLVQSGQLAAHNSVSFLTLEALAAAKEHYRQLECICVIDRLDDRLTSGVERELWNGNRFWRLVDRDYYAKRDWPLEAAGQLLLRGELDLLPLWLQATSSDRGPRSRLSLLAERAGV